MRRHLLFPALFFLSSTSLIAQLTYPITKKVNQVDEYFGIKVEDPYRWLENDSTEEVKKWVNEENKVTRDYFSSIPFREKIRERIKALNDVPYYNSPMEVGEYYFYRYNIGLQPQSVIYRQKGLTGKGEIFIDPNTLSAEGTISVHLSGYSEDKKYISTITKKAGSDWAEINIVEVSNGKKMPDELKWIKNTGISWKGNGLFYSRYPAQSTGNELLMKNENQKVYFHRLGTPQEDDLLIFEDRTNPLTFNYAFVTEDKRFLFISSFSGQSKTDIYYRDFESADSTLKLLIKGMNDVSDWFLANDQNKFIYYTTRNAPNGKIVLIDPTSPDPSSWKTIKAEQPELLENPQACGGKLFLGYLKDVTSRYYQYTYEGKLEREIKFPDLGSASGFEGLKTDSVIFYGFSSYLYPYTIFRYNIRTGISEKHFVMNMKMRAEDYETAQVFYHSKDGTKVPMFIVSKKGIRFDGSHPALLYAYGGYDVNVTPNFNPGIFPLLDAGGIYAVANIRGGGEYGEKWHEAGMLLKTQNRFDDFIAAAEYLISYKYTSSNKLGIYGASHGGCLVGSVMLQRPDLFKVAIPQVGTLDMLRFPKFTIGWNWVREYGRPDSLVDFKNLLAYSPVHNVKPAVKYPATLVMTADHDDRVVPMHSFKFISELQAKQAGANPVIIRIDTNSGHGGSSFIKALDDFSDIVFFCYTILVQNYNESG